MLIAIEQYGISRFDAIRSLARSRVTVVVKARQSNGYRECPNVGARGFCRCRQAMLHYYAELLIKPSHPSLDHPRTLSGVTSQCQSRVDRSLIDVEASTTGDAGDVARCLMDTVSQSPLPVSIVCCCYNHCINTS